MYSQKLPDGLIRSGIPYPFSDEDDQPIPMDDIVKLWRAHFVMRSAQPSETGSRLEYFFWRIMGNPRLRQILKESQIARFHAAISKDTPIRTTPHQSPIKADLQNNSRTAYIADTRSLPDSRRLGVTERYEADSSAINASITRERSTSRPQPILRTPGIDTSHTGKSARILTPTWGSNAKGKLPFKEDMFDVRGSPLITQSSSSAAPEDGLRGSSSGVILQESTSPAAIDGVSRYPKRCAPFTVSSKRRRPSMASKRSSQSASSTNSRSPESSPTTTQQSLDIPSKLPEPSPQQPDTSSKNQPTSSSRSSISAPKSPSPSPNLPESNSNPPSRRPSTPLIAPNLLNPQIRAIATKSALSTGLSSTSPITASLQPFPDHENPAHLSIRTPARSGNHLTSGTQADIDTLNRSRENLNQLLERDRRRVSGQKKGRKS